MIVSVREYDGRLEVSVLPNAGGTCDFTELKEDPVPTGETVTVWDKGTTRQRPRDKTLTRWWSARVTDLS